MSWPHLKHTVATQGLNENFTYSSSGNLLTDKWTDTATPSNTRLWTYTYNGTGQLLTAQSPRSDLTAITTYGYTGGTLTSITDPLSHVTTINTATGGGLPEKWTDPNGVHATIAYNIRNWPTSSVIATSAGNLTTSFDYDSAGNLTKTTLPDNSYLVLRLRQRAPPDIDHERFKRERGDHLRQRRERHARHSGRTPATSRSASTRRLMTPWGGS